MYNLKEERIGALNCYVRPGKSNSACVVLFHGYGADASDLVPLADMMNLSSDITWIFPGGPLKVIIGPGFYGKAWFHLDSRRLEQSIVNGEPLDMRDSKPQGLDEAARVGREFFAELKKIYKKIILGGFSQGAMLSTEIAFTANEKPDGIILMSGTLIKQNDWRKLAKSCEGLRYIQSHGKNDAILGFEFATSLHELLQESGLAGEFVAFSGGHEIPPKVIEKISFFIKNCLR